MATFKRLTSPNSPWMVMWVLQLYALWLLRISLQLSAQRPRCPILTMQSLCIQLQRPSVDLNGVAPVSHSILESSLGETSTMNLSKLNINTASCYTPRSNTSTPRIPTRANEGNPEILQASFFQWLNNMNILDSNHGFLTPQPRLFTDHQLLRRQNISAHLQRQRNLIL